MKTTKKCIFFLLLFVSQFVFSQRENENWTFGYNKWNFNYDTGNLTTTTFSSPPYLYSVYNGSATYSDPVTGELLFYTDGLEIFNKNHQLMENGSGMFASSPDYDIIINGLVSGGGLTTLQPTIIIPHPIDQNLYFVFFNGIYTQKTWYTTGEGGEYAINGNDTTNLGLRYAIVDLSYNGGLGKVTSQDNTLMSSISSGLTMAKHRDGLSYWLITQKGDKFYVYKISSNGLQTTPVVSNAFNVANIIKVSPDGKTLFSGNTLYDFDSDSGVITSPNDFTSISNEDFSGVAASYAEFSPNSKILYFVTGFRCLCVYPGDEFDHIGIAKYNLETGELVGREIGGFAKFPIHDVASLQLAANNKIYLTFTHHYAGNYQSQKIISVSKTWATIDNPNVWDANSHPVSQYFNFDLNDERYMSLTFPQVLPSSLLCIENLNITTPITSSEDFQVSNLLTASSKIHPNLNVSFKGKEVLLDIGFEVSSFSNGNFSAEVDPCSTIQKVMDANRYNENIIIQENLEIFNFTNPILYPNPTNGLITVENAKEILEWEVVDIYGKVSVFGTNNKSEEKISINLSVASPGLYYFNGVLRNGGIFQNTLIKK